MHIMLLLNKKGYSQNVFCWPALRTYLKWTYLYESQKQACHWGWEKGRFLAAGRVPTLLLNMEWAATGTKTALRDRGHCSGNMLCLTLSWLQMGNKWRFLNTKGHSGERSDGGSADRTLRFKVLTGERHEFILNHIRNCKQRQNFKMILPIEMDLAQIA